MNDKIIETLRDIERKGFLGVDFNAGHMADVFESITNELSRVRREKAFLLDFAIKAQRDYDERDKMFLYVGDLRQDSGYNAYRIDAEQADVRPAPLTFEQYLRAMKD